MDEENVVYNGISCSHEKKEILPFVIGMDELRVQYAK
jgi:hypothetical protein